MSFLLAGWGVGKGTCGRVFISFLLDWYCSRLKGLVNGHVRMTVPETETTLNGT